MTRINEHDHPVTAVEHAHDADCEDCTLVWSYSAWPGWTAMKASVHEHVNRFQHNVNIRQRDTVGPRPIVEPGYTDAGERIPL